MRDVREFALPAGESDLHFIDIAATVNPATVHFRSLTDPARVSVLEQNIEASYLAGGLSWQSDYVLTVDRDDRTAGLDGWVTLTNGSSTAFRDATLQFVAGDLNRVRPAARRQALEMMAGAAADAPWMAQEAFSEYHLDTLGRRTTIANQETKQLALLNGAGVPVEKRYVVDGQ